MTFVPFQFTYRVYTVGESLGGLGGRLVGEGGPFHMASNRIVSWGNDKIEWSDDLLVHAEQEDDDHREMFALMNQIFSAAQLGTDMVTQAVADLCLFTREHFAREQHSMEHTDYPGREAHRYEHEYLVFQLDALIERLMISGPDQVADELVDLLKRWLRDHILTHDAAYSDYLRTRG